MGYVSTTTLPGVENHEIQITTVPSEQAPSKKTLVVLPGFRYPSEAPALFYPRMAFSKHGWDVVSFDYRYNEIPGFIDMEEEEADQQIRDETALIGEFIVSNIQAGSLCILAKSLGTTVMHHLISNGAISPHYKRISWIVLTPTEFQRELVRHMIGSNENGFFAIGNNDPYYDAELIRSTREHPNLHWEVVQNAGHVFDDTGKDLATSIDNVRALTMSIEERILHGWFG